MDGQKYILIYKMLALLSDIKYVNEFVRASINL